MGHPVCYVLSQSIGHATKAFFMAINICSITNFVRWSIQNFPYLWMLHMKVVYDALLLPIKCHVRPFVIKIEMASYFLFQSI